MTGSLMLRKTRNYVGTYMFEDQWEDIGSFKTLASGTVVHNAEGEAEEYDPCEPLTTTLLVCVETTADPAKVVEALEDVHTINGCACEHDCCGCRSSTAEAKHLAGDRYEVVIGSSRNF